jgi:sigma-B regulation protein RsbU (phosphoserine phosphatase)
MSSDRYLALRVKLTQLGWPPRSRLGRIAFFILALNAALFIIQKLIVLTGLSSAQILGAWVRFLTLLAVVLFSWLGFRWLRRELLWRLRNRLIVTYMFIGVIPVVLLLTLSLTAFYLFAGQFATFIVTSGAQSELKTLHAANSATSHALAAQL